MGKIQLYNEQESFATLIPNLFIDKYMMPADGEYVKIFLYLLRCLHQADCDLSISGVADYFDHTEKDIVRALKYWEKVHLLRLEYDGEDLKGICILEDVFSKHLSKNTCVPLSSSKKPTTGNVTAAFTDTVSIPPQKEYSPSEIASFCEENDIQVIMHIAERYLARTLTQTDINTIFYWYDCLKMPLDLIEYLIETCIGSGHKSLHYMNKIAEDFFTKGISSLEQAKQHTTVTSRVYRTVARSFGLNHRSFASTELEYIQRWTEEYHYDSELIKEACDRTISQTQKPQFRYADNILKKWKDNKVKNLSDVHKLDEVFYASKKSGTKTSKRANLKSTDFSKFKQRDTNFDSLENKLLKRTLRS